MPTFQYCNTALHYEVQGSGTPLVLLHGFGSSGRDWEYQLPNFASQFQVVMPDFRGFGRSGRIDPFTVRQFSDDVLALIDHLELERVHLLGFSMGGAAAFQLALDAPTRIDKLVLVNTSPSFVPTTWKLKLEYLVRTTVVRTMGMERMAGVIARRLFPNPEQEDLRQRLLPRYAANDTDVYLSVMRGLRSWTVTDRLNEIAAHTLVIAAEHDYTPIADKTRYTKLIQKARLEVIADSRHGTPFDQPEIFNTLVLEFLMDETLELPSNANR